MKSMSQIHTNPNILRIAVGQFNPTVGDVSGNLAWPAKRVPMPLRKGLICCFCQSFSSLVTRRKT